MPTAARRRRANPRCAGIGLPFWSSAAFSDECLHGILRLRFPALQMFASVSPIGWCRILPTEVPAMKIKTWSLVIGAVITIAIVAIVAGASRFQFGSRYTSPAANVTTTVAGKRITIDYYAPSMHGRKIMGG